MTRGVVGIYSSTDTRPWDHKPYCPSFCVNRCQRVCHGVMFEKGELIDSRSEVNCALGVNIPYEKHMGFVLLLRLLFDVGSS
jgi:hypothetical protein